MKNNPSISVLMSTYKENPAHVREAIESILQQTFPDFELIIINDNPQDYIIDSVVKNFSDSRIRYYRNSTNLGLARCMNYAATLASSRVIARMDADDVAMPQRFQKQIELLYNGNCDLVCSRFSTINDQGAQIESGKGIIVDVNEELNKRVQINPQSVIHHPTVMFYREIFDKVGGYREFPCAQDLDLWMRMAEVGCRVRCISEPLLKYRINQNSISHKKHFMQQLTVHYSYMLSIERLDCGKDSFSIENYEKYLEHFGWRNKEKEKNFEKFSMILKKAKLLNDSGQIVWATILRIWVVMRLPSLRQYYFNTLKKKFLTRSKNKIFLNALLNL